MEDQEIQVNVPASTGNLGSGFDCVGMAINIWNQVTMKKHSDWDEPGYWLRPTTVKYVGERSFKNVPTSKDLILLSIKQILEKNSVGMDINCDTNIPLSRGLGSSSAAIAAGLLLGSKLRERTTYSTEELIKIGIPLEGHPDNIAPTMLGGCIISIHNNKWLFSKISIPQNLNLIIFIPDIKFETKQSRSLLNPMVTRENAVFNLGRVALLINCLNTKNYSLLKYATQDMIHQDTRFENFPNIKHILKSGLKAGALSGFLAGSGPSIIFFSEGREMTIKYELQECARKHNINGEIIITQPTNKGAYLKSKT